MVDEKSPMFGTFRGHPASCEGFKPGFTGPSRTAVGHWSTLQWRRGYRYEFKSTGTFVAVRFSGMAMCCSRSFRRWVNSGGNSSR